ncbi:hypothetical protein L0B70_00300 [Kaistella sp. 97-N-M2]|uniref:hypothetical protein n=1 Tax=Kaistella sp. 97-N-M2 TaxID=2908645 RepID=UPI001F3A8B04|nr:hypothetical protein [Kaistella sp. 97-N-M2]UJF29868.1 hypothetical protein L0B70_00300 [Kaistella sp. 97-N-M2]
MPTLNKIYTLTITPEQFVENCSTVELQELSLVLDSELKRRSEQVQICRVCGCTDCDCAQCIEKTGEPCYWVEPDLCSACVAVENFKRLTE